MQGVAHHDHTIGVHNECTDIPYSHLHSTGIQPAWPYCDQLILPIAKQGGSLQKQCPWGPGTEIIPQLQFLPVFLTSYVDYEIFLCHHASAASEIKRSGFVFGLFAVQDTLEERTKIMNFFNNAYIVTVPF